MAFIFFFEILFFSNISYCFLSNICFFFENVFFLPFFLIDLTYAILVKYLKYQWTLLISLMPSANYVTNQKSKTNEHN